MATGAEVLNMLIPSGGWVIYGNDFDGITFIEATPITEKQFKDGFAAYDAWKAEQDAEKANARNAIYDRLGLTADELALLLA
jgi:hypothetical protein